ncbi:Oidioi.mRNA.OKI2018_I69.chr1.g67.t1.cds [Oikopleura dioica]|uniref:Oidioi.mRNA.OKI2018_I69.chr1.g67.t1.cds n=1 Tax=Oikopleura dioica TaxID=34765 RepID=A0ABN7SSZ9_OIKDI|nr:Oidioi.mRNA.OKI2018_I69.chr1.g67.t1.cds [Oikopleura dioica]
MPSSSKILGDQHDRPLPKAVPSKDSSEEKSKNNIGYFIVGAIFILAVIFLNSDTSSGAGACDGDSNLPCDYDTTVSPEENTLQPSSFNFATSFSNEGLIDLETVGICDGNHNYSVSAHAFLQSPNYPNNYDPFLECTTRFSTNSDGLTFEFTKFEVEHGFDNLVFRDSSAEEYAFSGIQTGMTVSFSSSYVDVHFESDHSVEDSGFSLKVKAGYESSFDAEDLY